MKIYSQIIVLVSTLLSMTACNLPHATVVPPSQNLQEVVFPTQETEEKAIKTALAAHLGVEVDDLSIVIDQNTGRHARGGVDNGYFLAVKADGEWQIVADGQAMPDCPIIAQYDFPTSMVPECSYSTPLNDEEAIGAALAAHLGVNVNDLNIVIDQNTGRHARGGVDNGYFLAAKADNKWQIVADGQAMPNCKVVKQYGFPPTMVPECQGSNEIEEIHFKPGGTYSFVQNSISTGERHTYTLRAKANQTMIVSAASNHNDVFVGIHGIQGGQQLLSNSAGTAYWTGTLPQTQDYAITLTTNSLDTIYFLEIEIPANIRFNPGAYSTVVEGHIEILNPTSSESIDNHVTYLIHASAGQTLDVHLSSPHLDALSTGLYGQQDGQPYRRYQVKNSGYYGVLPITQGYFLKVFSNGISTDFTLKITII